MPQYPDTETPRLRLPFLAAAQSQKHVTHNEALSALDILVQLAVKSAVLSIPPATPSNGDCYLVPNNSSGDWQGKTGQVAAFQDNGWLFYAPQQGWRVWVMDDEKIMVFQNTQWQDMTTNNNQLSLVGVNTTADTTNRLSVKSDAVLLSHDDVTPGSGNIQVKVNKAASAQTASHLFQTNWSGRAEIGLTGNDNFHFKVSADGTNWAEAIILDKDSGAVQMPQNNLTENLVFNIFKDAGRFAGVPESTSVIAGSFVPPSYLFPYNSSAFSAYGKFTHNNSTNGGAQTALAPEVDSFIKKIKTTASGWRYGPEFFVMEVAMGAGTTGAVTIGGVTRYLPFVNRAAPLWMRSTWGINIRVISGSVSADYSPSTFGLYQDGTEATASLVVSAADGWKQLAWVGREDPSTATDYSSSLFKLRAETGSIFLVALPFMIPAQLLPKAGKLFGRIPSLEVWR